MKDPLKLILTVVGIALIAYGAYTIMSPDAVIDAGPIKIKAKSGEVDTQSIIMIVLGVLALFGGMFYKKK